MLTGFSASSWMALILGSTAWNVNSVAGLLSRPPARNIVGTQRPKSTSPPSDVLADVPVAGSASAACCAAVPVRLAPADEDPATLDGVAEMRAVDRVVAAAEEAALAAAGGATGEHSPAPPAAATLLLEDGGPLDPVALEEAAALPTPELPGAPPLLPARSSVVKLLKPFAANICATLIPVEGKGVVRDWFASWLASVEPTTAGSIFGRMLLNV